MPTLEVRVMGKGGDTKTIFNPDNADEVASAKKQWDELVGKKRFKAFRVRENGEPGEQITSFDPHAGKIIYVPPMAGG